MTTAHKTFTRLVFSLGLALTALHAHAVEMVVTGTEMQSLMKPFLPYRLDLGEWKVDLTNPKPEFQPDGQHIALGFDMALQDAAAQSATAGPLKAYGKIGGQLHYDGETKQLQLVKPTLLDFQVLEGNATPFAPLVDQLKTRLGYHLPIIILLDAQRLGPGAQYFTPSSISVVQNGVSLNF
ncbi:MAG: hypothetical protein IPM37_00795 [Hahellaceae bacterium]|nr:hypothetical protein [Hahellaceae bacterium]